MSDENVGLGAVKNLIEEQGQAWDLFKRKSEIRDEEISRDLARLQRPSMGLGGGWESLGQTTEQRAALTEAVRALLVGDNQAALDGFARAEAKGMSAGLGAAGGYTVVPQFSSQMTKIMAEVSPLYGLARTVELERGDAFEEVVDRDQAEASWVAELSTRNDTASPDLGLFRVELAEICAQPKVSQKLIDTSTIDIVSWLQGKVAEAFAVTESAAFHSGNGVAKPRGFLDYATATTSDLTRTWGTLQHIATGASGAFPTASTSVNSADPLVDVIAALKVQYRAGASWIMSRGTAGAVRKLKDADGRWVWTDSLSASEPSLLLGYPVYESEDMPAISAGSLSIAFGNWGKGYTIARRQGTKFLADPLTDKPNVKLFAYARVGGGVNNFEAIKLLKFS